MFESYTKIATCRAALKCKKLSKRTKMAIFVAAGYTADGFGRGSNSFRYMLAHGFPTSARNDKITCGYAPVDTTQHFLAYPLSLLRPCRNLPRRCAFRNLQKFV